MTLLLAFPLISLILSATALDMDTPDENNIEFMLTNIFKGGDPSKFDAIKAEVLQHQDALMDGFLSLVGDDFKFDETAKDQFLKTVSPEKITSVVADVFGKESVTYGHAQAHAPILLQNAHQLIGTMLAGSSPSRRRRAPADEDPVDKLIEQGDKLVDLADKAKALQDGSRRKRTPADEDPVGQFADQALGLAKEAEGLADKAKALNEGSRRKRASGDEEEELEEIVEILNKDDGNEVADGDGADGKSGIDVGDIHINRKKGPGVDRHPSVGRLPSMKKGQSDDQPDVDVVDVEDAGDGDADDDKTEDEKAEDELLDKINNATLAVEEFGEESLQLAEDSSQDFHDNTREIMTESRKDFDKYRKKISKSTKKHFDEFVSIVRRLFNKLFDLVE